MIWPSYDKNHFGKIRQILSKQVNDFSELNYAHAFSSLVNNIISHLDFFFPH